MMSVVTPCYNEELNVTDVYEQVRACVPPARIFVRSIFLLIMPPPTHGRNFETPRRD